MGMSASQAKLLYLTAQLNNLSLKGQSVSDAKIRLSMDTQEIQEKYINALNSTRLFVNSNIFASSGSTTTSEYITLANLKAQGLMVSDGSKILGYSYQKVKTDATQKVLTGYEDDLTKPIYPKIEVDSDGLEAPSATANGDAAKMQAIVDATGLGADDLEVKSYTTVINGQQVELNSISINSQAGFEAIYEKLQNEAVSGNTTNSLQQNYILNTDSIDMSKYVSTGIPYFQGVFDGNGATIKGLSGEQGLFRDVYGTIKNLTIDGANITAESDAVGAVAGYLGDGGLIENCNVTNINLTSNLKNQEYSEGYTSERAGIGGTVGFNNGSIRNTSVQGTISIPNADESFGYIGGFVGANVNPTYGAEDNIIENCYSDVNISLGSGKNYSNSINGFIGDDTYEAIVKNCMSLGSITTANGSAINGSDLANWGPLIESNVTNLVALDTRNNNDVLYWANSTDPSFANGSRTQPDSLTDAKVTTPDGNDIYVWLNPGTNGYSDQNQASASNNNLPVLNLSELQAAGLTGGKKWVEDKTQDPIGYQQKPRYEEIPVYETQLVEDPNFSISSQALEQGLRSGAYTLVKESSDSSTQTISLNGLFYEVVSLSSCTSIVDQQEDGAAEKAEAEYNKAMEEIQAKDKRYELDQKKIDTEYNACLQEEESIKTVLNKNIERSFKTFG